MTENSSPCYSTRDEFIEREIIDAIEAGGIVSDARLEYDVDAIANEVIDSDVIGYDAIFFWRDGVDFWDIVQAHDIADGDYRILWGDPDDDGMSVVRLIQWSSEDQGFNEIDSLQIQAADYNAIHHGVKGHYRVEKILRERNGLDDVIVVSNLR